ncbi:MAG: hypothetical protein ACFCU8_18985 [Thermosynechococcaceae cyanobacterium]
MSFVVSQIVYSSFPKVGYQVFASPDVSAQLKSTFVEQIVYVHWDVYEPPPEGYRAGFVHQISLAQTFFGWIFNDGTDDYGRLHTPYCLGYYLKQTLEPDLVDLMLQCLQAGPCDLISRQTVPSQIERVKITQRIQTAAGISITAAQQQQVHQQVHQQQLLQFLFAHQDSSTPVLETNALESEPQWAENLGNIDIVPDLVVPDRAADMLYPLGQDRLPAIPMNFVTGTPHSPPEGSQQQRDQRLETPDQSRPTPQARQLVGAITGPSLRTQETITSNKAEPQASAPEDLASQIVSILDELL